ncbi:MAG: nucleotide-binding protein [Gemmatimonadota bacterium]|nr:nucleotide-binding protein [Gemmatimonadota bacterium]
MKYLFSRTPLSFGVGALISRAFTIPIDMATVADDAARVLEFLYGSPASAQHRGPDVQAATGLTPKQINDAVTILVENGYATWHRFLGTAPFDFGIVHITSRGRHEYEVARREADVEQTASIRDTKIGAISPPRTPVGSPYGFQDEDWEIVTARRSATDKLYVVLGYQFESTHYDSEALKVNVRATFEAAVEEYNRLPGAVPASLEYQTLSAGYGEHLFNQIARDIISADIAIFETSDLNPNVMLELGVALTWGVRVLVIKKGTCPKPPSDVSGHTWADHDDNAGIFTDPEHPEKLLRMVERAVRKKGRA